MRNVLLINAIQRDLLYLIFPALKNEMSDQIKLNLLDIYSYLVRLILID